MSESNIIQEKSKVRTLFYDKIQKQKIYNTTFKLDKRVIGYGKNSKTIQ